MNYLKKITSGFAALTMVTSLFGSFAPVVSAAPGSGWDLRNADYTIQGLPVGDKYAEGNNEWLLVDSVDELEHIAVLYKNAKDTADAEITKYNIKLDKDINMIGREDWSMGIGTETTPFNREFDGDKHTIDYLKTSKNLGTSDGGLFGYTGPDAVIHDFIIDHSSVQSVLRGGVVVGYATKTQIYNVSVKNTEMKLRSGGAGVELITAGGIRGGAIAGVASDNTYFYNCTSYNTKIYVNSDAGLSAAAGDGFFLGGIVGTMDSSTIEYSRVTGDNAGVTFPWDNDKSNSSPSTTFLDSDYNAKVQIDYTTGVSALAGLTLYTGGIVGRMKGNDSKIIDCFSNTHVGYYGRMTVSVGAGVSGAAGGIVGLMTDSGGTILRCHFAGLLTSRTYNNVLGIGGYTNNSNLGGIVGKVGGNAKTLQNVNYCYFDWDRAAAGKSKPSIPAIQGASATNCEMITHDSYDYQSSWITNTYDFDHSPDKKREKQPADRIHTIDGGRHYNIWVIDRNATMLMPVHGYGLSAMTDFPGAGIIAIEGTEYRDEVSTDGYKDKENKISGDVITQQIFPDSDPNSNELLPGKATLTATVTPREGAQYVFHGWTRTNAVDDIVEVYTVEDGQWYVTPYKNGEPQAKKPYDNPLKDGDKYTLTSEFDSGDLFTANYKAEIVFHVLTDPTTDNSTPPVTYPVVIEYGYKEMMDFIENPYITGLSFKYWTREKRDTVYDPKTEESIPKKESKRFEVIEPVDLYAVFEDASNNNIHVSIQSVAQNEAGGDIVDPAILGKLENKYKFASAPEGQAVGNVTGNSGLELDVLSNKKTDGGYERTDVNAENENERYTGPIYDDSLSYRFLGWWELQKQEDDTYKWVQISQAMTSDPEGNGNRELILDDVDVSEEHYYQARYSYRVRFWAPARFGQKYYYGESAPNPSASLYRTTWATYGEDIRPLPEGPSYRFAGGGTITYLWWTSETLKGPYEKDTWNYTKGDLDKLNDRNKYPEFESPITGPTDLYEIVKTDGYVYTNNIIMATTDFDLSDAAKAKVDDGSNGSKFTLELSPHYNSIGYEPYTISGDGSLDFNKGKSGNFSNKDQSGTAWKKTKWTPIDDSPAYTASMDQSWGFTGGQNVINARISANIYQHGKKGELIEGGAVIDSDINPEPWKKSSEVTATRKYDSRLFNNNDEDTTPEASLATAQVEISGSSTPVGTGKVINEKSSKYKVYEPGYKFLGWTSKTDEKAFEGWGSSTPEWKIGEDRPINQEYIVVNTDQTVGKLLAENERVHSAMWLYPAYAEFKIKTKTNPENVEGITKPTYSINAGEQNDKATIEKIQVTDLPEGYRFRDVDIYRDGEYVRTVKANDIVGGKFTTAALDPNSEYEFVANYTLTVVFHNTTAVDRNQTKRYNPGDEIGEMPESTLKNPLAEGYVFAGWTTTEPTNEKGYVDGLANIKLVNESDTVNAPMHLYPVYAKPSITVYAYLTDDDNKPNITNDIITGSTKVVTTKNGETVISVYDTYDQFNKHSGIPYGIVEIRPVSPAGEIEDIETASGNTLSFTPKAGVDYVFYAVYGPTVTYMIPSVEAGKITYTGSITENVEYGTQKTLHYYKDGEADGETTYSIDVHPDANEEVRKGLLKTKYGFKSAWRSNDKKEDATDEEVKEYGYEKGTDPQVSVTVNIDLYPYIGKTDYITIRSNLDDEAYITRDLNRVFSTLNEEEAADLKVTKENEGYTVFVGFALVDDKKNCLALYPEGIQSDVLDSVEDEYTIYAVFSQQKMHDALQNQTAITGAGDVYVDGAVRSLTKVNTAILDKVGIAVKDEPKIGLDEFGTMFNKFSRHALFALSTEVAGKVFKKDADGGALNGYYVDIACDTSESEPTWDGNIHLPDHESGWDVFSVAGGLKGSSLTINDVSSVGYLVFHYSDDKGDKTVYAQLIGEDNSSTEPETEEVPEAE